MPKPQGGRAIARRIRSLALTSGPGSVFAIRDDRVDEVAARIERANPYVTVDDNGLRQSILSITLRDKTLCLSPADAQASARATRFDQQNNIIEVSDASSAMALLSPREKLEHDATGKYPPRLKIREAVVKGIPEALQACSPSERLRYQAGHGLPTRITVKS